MDERSMRVKARVRQPEWTVAPHAQCCGEGDNFLVAANTGDIDGEDWSITFDKPPEREKPSSHASTSRSRSGLTTWRGIPTRAAGPHRSAGSS
jgi:hypothetical protein